MVRLDFNFPFVVEVKLRKDIKFEKINATLKNFWDQNFSDLRELIRRHSIL